MTQLKHVTVTREDGVCVARCADRTSLEELSIAELGEEISSLVEAETGIKLLLDFKNVEHLSSAALGMLITVNQAVGRNEGHLVLAEIDPNIYEVFKITRLNKLFEIYETSQEALQKF